MTAVALLVSLLCAQALGAAAAIGAAGPSSKRLGYALTPSKTTPYTPCPPGGKVIECNIVLDPPPVRTAAGYRLPGGGPLLEGGGELGGYDPTDLQSAYGIPSSGGTGETVGIVDAYGYAAAESDLAKYREKYGLEACTKTSGCFKKVNEKGEEANYPPESGELEKVWSLETALDLDMVSAACPKCHILLVEATTQEPKDTAGSVEEAAKLGATEISNSYGYPENNETWCPGKKGCKEYLAAYDHAGIPVTVSSGDSGYLDGVGAPSWPATSPNIVAVGGTSLKKSEDSRGWSEQVWSDSGSGCSLYEAKPSWQFDAACNKRMDNDVAAVAAPETPVSVYNTHFASGWELVGGTSVSAPLVAGIEAHAASAVKSAGAEAFYKHPGMLFDVSTGRNGTCSTPAEDAYECQGEVGYDGPTGWGTPDAIPRLTGWFTREIPSLPVDVDQKSHLAGASCFSGTEVCVAVGGSTSSLGSEVAMSEVSRGGAWELQETPAPAGKDSALVGVTCGSGEACVAVGHYVNSGGTEVPLVERWLNGTGRWTIQTVAVPAGAKSGSLSKAWCLGSESCTAVGHYVNSSGTELPLAEHWAGGSWVVVEVATPKEAKSSELSSVYCVIAVGVEGCQAVGHDVNGAGTQEMLAELGLGKKWEVRATPIPKEAKSSSLSDMSCLATTCFAVGHYVDSAGTEETAAERSTGKWELQTTPNPKEAKRSGLESVSCSGASACTAVGSYVNSAGKELTLAERWNGTTWAIQEAANPAEAKSSALTSVTCAAAESCQAVGHYVNGNGTEVPLVEHWNGKEWAIKEAQTPEEANGGMPGVSCASGEACTAVGHYVNGAATEVTLAEGWNGKEWLLQETVNPSGAKASALSGVSCASSEACTAVGHYANSSGTEVTLAEGWSSKKWALQETVNPVGAKASALSGVSCSSSEACTAVGHYVNSSGTEVTLAERWNGKAWTVQETVNPAGAKSSALTGVSCAGAEACTAVGHYVNSSGTEVTLAEGWNGKEWLLQETVNPSGAKASALSGVSCSSGEACTAVGHYANSSGTEVTLAEAWSSKTWATQESPNPVEANSSALAGVSCRSAEMCIASGRDLDGSAEQALVEEYA